MTQRAEQPDRGIVAVERAFDRAAGHRGTPGNRVSLLIDGHDTYAAMHAQIDGARRRVHLENYIFRDDATGRAFAERLAARAREGVAVRVLYDWLGSIGTSRRFWRDLRAAGVQVCAFGPPRLADPLLIFARDHRKLLVVDGERAVTGGLCIGDEWVGNPAKSRLPWRDTAMEIQGPAARVLDTAFSRSWTFAGGASPDDAAELDSDVAPAGEAEVHVVATEPGRERAFRAIDLMLGVSASRIWITEAYLAAPQRLYQAIIDAANDGADVRLLLPGSSDLRVVRNFSRAGYRGLLRAGVRIWEWNGPMLHAKTIVADTQLVRVGSSNLNVSSLLANWELDVFMNDRALARQLEHQYLGDLATSSEVLLRPRRIPSVFGRAVPPALARRLPHELDLQTHNRSFREKRQRAIVLVGGLIRGARAALFGPLAVLLLVAAVMFALFPRPMALVSAIVAGLSAVALGVRALGHRARG